MTKQNLYVDINVLQTVPSSNINRDDTGAPKTAVFGGVTRSRVSSQSWKRAIRQSFEQQSDGADWLDGIRSTQLPVLLADKIQELDSELDHDEATDLSLAVFKQAGIKVDKNTQNTRTLLMLSEGQLTKLAKYVTENDEIDKKAIKQTLKSNNSLDLALFGRMVADDNSLNVDASCQVAHAVSTHELVPEFDYFTAIDDEQKAAGSAMIGTVEYNSATLYRYANVNMNELIHNLGDFDVAIKGLKLFVKDFILSMPTGMQNSFANKTVPQYVMVTVRQDTPVNLVSAFEEPVTSRNGYVQPSIEKLEAEYAKTQKFVEKPVALFVLTNENSELKEQADDLNTLLNNVAHTIETRVSDENSNN